ncbi:hypothetical protein ES703_79106 [subsurface metagenome]
MVPVGRKAEKRIGFHDRPAIARPQVRHPNLRHAGIAADPASAAAAGADVTATYRREKMDVAWKRLVPLPAAHLAVAQEEVGAVSRPREVRSFHDGKRCGAVFPGQVMVEEVTGHEWDVASSFGGIVVVSVVMVTGNDHRMSGVHHQGVVPDLPIAG